MKIPIELSMIMKMIMFKEELEKKREKLRKIDEDNKSDIIIKDDIADMESTLKECAVKNLDIYTECALDNSRLVKVPIKSILEDFKLIS